jgi:hypothetical protein
MGIYRNPNLLTGTVKELGIVMTGDRPDGLYLMH